MQFPNNIHWKNIYKNKSESGVSSRHPLLPQVAAENISVKLNNNSLTNKNNIEIWKYSTPSWELKFLSPK